MGGISTSHSASLSNHKASASKEFDLRNWRGLTDLLRVGRESIPDPRAYAEFRNLVLGYAQRGGDAEIRRNIDTIVATFSQNKVPVEAPEKKLEVKQVASTPAPEPVVPVPERKIEESEPEKVIESTSVAPSVGASLRPTLGIPTRRMQPRFNNGSTQVFIPKEVSDVVLPQTHQSMMTPSTFVPEVSSELEAENEDEPQSETPVLELEHEVPKTQEEYKARITEIKHLVHEKVGNPVALMGAHSAHGKKYMTALLSALKATSAGSLDEMHVALETLEKVTKALLEDAPLEQEVVSETKLVVDPGSVSVGERKSIPVLSHEEVVPEVLTPEEETVHKIIPEVLVEAMQSPIHEPHATEIRPDNNTREDAVAQTSEEVVKPIFLKEEGRIPLHTYSASEILAKKDTHHSEHIIEDSVVLPSEGGERWSAHKSETRTEATIVASPAPGEELSHPRTKHVYKAIATTDPEVLKQMVGIDPHSVTTEQAELYSPRITEALQQLLHEWTIFGGSGIFGIGPGGSEHPLYIKLSLLSMNEVLGGRWEKADPKLIKVIKQYVDAWRHEQGIAYTIDETFEHYLRRVVQKILKRQGGL